LHIEQAVFWKISTVYSIVKKKGALNLIKPEGNEDDPRRFMVEQKFHKGTMATAKFYLSFSTRLIVLSMINYILAIWIETNTSGMDGPFYYNN
jgi:hypothetical protein